MITVIVLGQPDDASALHAALESVRNQTAKSSIASVIVPGEERFECREALLRDFSDLNLQFASGRGNQILARQAALTPNVEYVALLAIGDTWAKHHLASGISILQRDPAVVATYSNFFAVEGDDQPIANSRTAWRVWLATQQDFQVPVILLDSVSTMLLALLDRNLLGSTLLARAAHFFDMVAELQSPDKLDFERIAAVQLSKRGRLAYNTRPGAFVHTGAAHEFLDEAVTLCRAREAAATTEWLRNENPSQTRDAADLFNATVHRLRAAAADWNSYRTVETVTHGIVGRQWEVLFSRCRFDLVPRQRENRGVRWLARQLCPPALITSKRRVKTAPARG